MDARTVLTKNNGVFIGRNCLFVSTTGKLLTGYVNCEVIFPIYPIMWDLTSQLIRPFLGKVDCIVCPSTGDIALLQYATIIANQNGYQTFAAWADKQPDNTFKIERNGFASFVRNSRVVVLNDRISQGGTTRKVIAEVRRLGGRVVGVATLAGVSSLTADALEVPRLNALCNIDVLAFDPVALPESYWNWPIVVDESLGHGSEFKSAEPDYPGGFITLLR